MARETGKTIPNILHLYRIPIIQDLRARDTAHRAVETRHKRAGIMGVPSADKLGMILHLAVMSRGHMLMKEDLRTTLESIPAPFQPAISTMIRHLLKTAHVRL